MKNIDWYLDEAKSRAGLGSDRKLGEFLGMAAITPSHWRSGRSWPSDDTMVKLAKLAGIDTNIALIELSVWRNKGPAQKAYASILHRLAHAMVIICAISSISPANALSEPLSKVSNVESASIYYGKLKGLLKWFWKMFFLPVLKAA